MEPKIGIAAGMIKIPEHVPLKLLDMVSHVTLGSYTLNPRPGNPEPNNWIHPSQNWMINAIGLKNQGVEQFIERDFERFTEIFFGKNAEFRVSLAPTGAGELKKIVDVINGHKDSALIDELEINAACPNHKKGDAIEPVLAYDMGAVEALLEEAADYTGAKALKIAPCTDREKLGTLVELCEAYDIQTIVSANTKKHTAMIDGNQVLSVESGGLSGTPLISDTMHQVKALSNIIAERKSNLRIFACGGVMTAHEAEVLFKQKGAAEVQIASLFWIHGPDTIAKLITETGLRMA